MKKDIVSFKRKRKIEALETLAQKGELDTKDQADLTQGEVITAKRQFREKKARNQGVSRKRGRSR